MQKICLIFGATGGFGSELVKVMRQRGWQIRAVSRNPVSEEPGVDWHQLDLLRAEPAQSTDIEALMLGVEAVVHAVNVPYPQWDPDMITITNRIIELVTPSATPLFFVGNIYNAGLPTDGLVTSGMQSAPVSRKGQIRAELERSLQQASEQGVPVGIVRYGDFFGPGVDNKNWFTEITKALVKGKLTLPGPADIPHTWAFLPDAAGVMEQVIDHRLQRLDPRQLQGKTPAFLDLPFSGHCFSGQELTKALSSLTKRKLRVSLLPWSILKLMGWFSPDIRELGEMRYLWQHDIRLDGAALATFLGQAPVGTPLNEALAQTLSID